MTTTRPRTARVAVLLALVGLLGLAAPAAAEDLACDIGRVPPNERLADTETESDAVHERLHVDEAQELATGRGTRVAVLDSGIAQVDGLRRADLYRAPGTSPTLLSGHGTIVSGLIAGDTGVAPDAEVVNVKVYDAEDADASQGEQSVTSRAMADGILAVVAAHEQRPFDVVNISLAVPLGDPALEEAMRRLVALDVVVVASSGNKPTGGETEGFKGTANNDAEVFPADYEGVLAVSATPPADDSPANYVLPNLDTDVAAPTLGAISRNATGEKCVIDQVATSWSAAEVSGLALLLRQRFPREDSAQIVARIMATTEGVGLAPGAARNPWTGAGIVQANDALTRELSPGPDGTIEPDLTSVDESAVAPPAPTAVDLLGPSRAKLLWFGLLAGGLMGLAFVLRPLLRR